MNSINYTNKHTSDMGNIRFTLNISMYSVLFVQNVAVYSVEAGHLCRFLCSQNRMLYKSIQLVDC